jgi:dTDP-glucose 4,6-dehydratase
MTKVRTLITGSMGFVGAHTVEHLLKNTDWDLVLLDRLDISGTLHRVKEIITPENENRIKFVWHDLKASINPFISTEIGKVDNIIHLAASSHVDRSIDDPLSFILDNVVGTTNLLIWANKEGMAKNDQGQYSGKFINFSTDEVFGPAPDGYAYKENDPHKPSNPYSASKSGQEAIGYAFHITYGLPIITTHTINNFGERQHPEKFVPIIIRALMRDEPVTIHAKIKDGKMIETGIRHWLHSRNSADAILFLIEKGTPGEYYNVIGFDELTNLEIAQKIADIIGKPLVTNFVDFHSVRPGHDRRYALDGSKMRDMGWSPPVSFDASLRKVVEWSLANPRWL